MKAYILCALFLFVAANACLATMAVARIDAQDYVIKPVNSLCENGMIDILSECEEAAAILNFDFEGDEEESDYPGGCYLYYGYAVYFNKNFAGAIQEDSQPICGPGTTTIPPTTTTSPSEQEKCLKEDEFICSKKSPCCDGLKCVAYKCIRPATTECIGWKQTRGCDPNGPREPQYDFSCDADIPNGASGYCQCNGGIKSSPKNCSQGEFRNCYKACKKASEFDATPLETTSTTSTTTSTTVYATGPVNSTCKNGMIDKISECEKAAKELNKDFVDEEEEVSNYPGGCYLWEGTLYFNKNFAGASEEESQPICSHVTCPATCKTCKFEGKIDGRSPIDSNGVCHYFCSKQGYCGNGDDHITGDDCTECKYPEKCQTNHMTNDCSEYLYCPYSNGKCVDFEDLPGKVYDDGGFNLDVNFTDLPDSYEYIPEDYDHPDLFNGFNLDVNFTDLPDSYYSYEYIPEDYEHPDLFNGCKDC